MKTADILTQSLIDYITDVKPYHTKFRDVTSQIFFSDSLNVNFQEDHSFQVYLQNIWTKDDVGGFLLSNISEGQPVDQTYIIPATIFPRFSLNDWLNYAQSPNGDDPSLTSLTSTITAGIPDLDNPWAGQTSISSSHQLGSDQVPVSANVISVTQEIVSQSAGIGNWQVISNFTIVIDISGEALYGFEPSSLHIVIGGIPYLGAYVKVGSVITITGYVQVFASQAAYVAAASKFQQLLASNLPTPYAGPAPSLLDGSLDPVQVLYLTTGRYAVPYHQGCRVRVNDVPQTFRTNYVVDKTRSFIQFLPGFHPASTDLLYFNLFRSDKIFVSWQDPFAYGTSPDVFTITVNADRSLSIIFTNAQPGTNKATIQNASITSAANVGDVWSVTASSAWSFVVQKITPLSSTVKPALFKTPYDDGVLSFTVDRVWTNPYAIPGSVIVPANALVSGELYTIVSVGTTDFTLLGASSNTIGLQFVAIAPASSSAGTGTGTAQADFNSYYIQQDRDIDATTPSGYFLIGSTYTIASIGTTDFTLIGASSNTIGLQFVATGPGIGTGSAFLKHDSYITIPATLLMLGATYTIASFGDLSPTDFTLYGASSNTIGLKFIAALTASAGSFIVGQAYKITSIGTTNFTLIGAASNTLGVTFIATGNGTGNGTATTQLLNITAGSLVPGVTYVIFSIGTTDFTLIGASSNTVGVTFTATGVGSGTGSVTTRTYIGSGSGSVFINHDQSEFFSDLNIVTEHGGLDPSPPLHQPVHYTPFGVVQKVGKVTAFGTEYYYTFKFDAIPPSGTYIELRVEQEGQYNPWVSASITEQVNFFDLLTFTDDLCSTGAHFDGQFVLVTFTAGSFVIGSTYVIVMLGTTDFTLIGASSNTVGLIFVATGAGSGTGTADELPINAAMLANSAGLFITQPNVYPPVPTVTWFANTVNFDYGGFDEDAYDTTFIPYIDLQLFTPGCLNVSTDGFYSSIRDDSYLTTTYQGYTVSAGSFVIGTTYTIGLIGSTDFTLIGASSNTVGVTFTATGVGSGTGEAYVPLSPIAAGAFIVGMNYTIASLGTTDFTLIGASTNIVGLTFTAQSSRDVVAGSFVVGSYYTIKKLGTTDFTTIGANANVLGLVFEATGTGTGTGTAIPKDYINAGSFVIGTNYIIASIGSVENPTDFTLSGAANNNVGTIFAASNVGTGSGTVTPAYTGNGTGTAYHARVRHNVELISDATFYQEPGFVIVPPATAYDTCWVGSSTVNDLVIYRAGVITSATALSAGKTYMIQSVGTTDFTLVGSATNLVGDTFVATGPGSGTGTASPTIQSATVWFEGNIITPDSMIISGNLATISFDIGKSIAVQLT